MVLKLTSKLLTKCNILTLFLMCLAIICNAHGIKGHNAELKEILFGKYNLSSKAEENFDLLTKAAYLTLDYFNNSMQGLDYYNDLKNYGVKDIPRLESIDFSGNKYHQKYTHMGWEYTYGVIDKANWEARKKILLNTVEKVCKFSKNKGIWSWFSTQTIDDSKKKDFAALIYDIHILGDHIGDMDATRYTRIRLVSEPDYRGQVVSPTSAGPFNNMTLYTYLLYHIQRLFRDQKNCYEYNELVKFLERHKDEFINSKDDKVPYENVQELANETKKVLARYIPKLLRNEAFFQRAFM